MCDKANIPSQEESMKNWEKFNDRMEMDLIEGKACKSDPEPKQCTLDLTTKGIFPSNSMEKHPLYRIQVFVSHGYFEYTVDRMEQAMAHAQAIMSTGVYRRAVDEETVEFHTAYKVKVRSNVRDLGSAYGDKFVRT